MSLVFFSRRGVKQSSFCEKVKDISLEIAKGFISNSDLVGIKVHFGELGNTEFLPPHYIKPVVDAVSSLGAKPFLFDTNTLYKGMRENARDHIMLASFHGFNIGSMGVPVIIADGLKGKDYVKVSIKGKHFNEVRLASALKQMDGVIVISHVKGHTGVGFGGAIKNISMGFASRSGKQQMHSDVKPFVDIEKCTSCGACIKWCPASAISIDTKKNSAFIDLDVCIGCGECRVTCPELAIDISWDTTTVLLQEKIAEYALGSMIVTERNIGFLNFVVNVTPDCDCLDWSGERLIEDIGVLGSRDPVAVDTASCDLLNEEWHKKGRGKDIWKELYPEIDWTIQISYAEKIGVGSRNYVLKEL